MQNDVNDSNNPSVGIVLMTYGSATTAEHVREYFESIYKGKASENLIADFENRYRLVGRSPLIDITKEQARLLEESLNRAHQLSGKKYIVRAGMRHSAPRILDAVAECRSAGVERLVGIILSPQFSSVIMEGYRTAFTDAALKNGFAEDTTAIAGPWPNEPHFIELITRRVKKSVAELGQKNPDIPLIFTTHSLPQSVVAKDPSYMDQLKMTSDAILHTIKMTDSAEHYSAYQSAGHTPEAWLKPDLTDILDIIVSKNIQKNPAVLIVPIQFLTDHLEILYDLDIAAKKQCEDRGIAYHRIDLPNTDPLFIEALQAIVLDTLEAMEPMKKMAKK